MKILLVSHGAFAEGIAATVRDFFGAGNIYTACVTLENGTADLNKKVEEYLSQWGDEQVVICSDVKGGSANQSVVPYMNRPNTFLISGMNLALLLQLHMETEVTAESLRDMIAGAREDMQLINDMSFEFDEDDE